MAFFIAQRKKMRYPNLRYGNPNEFAYYAVGISNKDMAKRLRRSEKSIKEWLSGKRKMPFWIPELLRLQRMEANERTRQMRMTPIIKRYNLPTAKIVNFRMRAETEMKTLELVRAIKLLQTSHKKPIYFFENP
ncbi:MAG: hypothetical protein HHJ12_11260 [Glaciimonas sp.]|nr:hypothetical protein [Glaciimonas sp.]